MRVLCVFVLVLAAAAAALHTEYTDPPYNATGAANLFTVDVVSPPCNTTVYWRGCTPRCGDNNCVSRQHWSYVASPSGNGTRCAFTFHHAAGGPTHIWLLSAVAICM